jgi:hypothetical protein
MVSWPSFSARVILAMRESIRLIHAYNTRIALPIVSSRTLPMIQEHTGNAPGDATPGVAAGPCLDPEEIAESGLVPQMGMVTRALWSSPVRNTLLMLGTALFLIIAATAYGQIRLNSWNQPFYDALSKHDLPEFLVQLGVFAMIAGALLALNVGQRWATEMLKLKLREGLVHDLVLNWMTPGRAFRLASAGPIGVNPDQRMHEDARHLTELSADLGLGLLQSSILLVTFVKVLWSLSSNFVFHVAGRHFVIPGYMVWAAVIYSGSASLLSYWVGRQPHRPERGSLRTRGRPAFLAGARQRAHRCHRVVAGERPDEVSGASKPTSRRCSRPCANSCGASPI